MAGAAMAPMAKTAAMIEARILIDMNLVRRKVVVIPVVDY